MLIQGNVERIRGKADKSSNDAILKKTLQDYMRHVEQQSHGRKSHTVTAAIHLTTFKNRASLLRVHKTL